MGRYPKGFLWATGLLAVVAIALRALLFKVWTIPDDPRLAASVAPTLAAGDVVLVLTRGEPGFGDLVRCTDPKDASRFVVGRIAGLGYDVVETDAHRLIVNGKRYDGGRACPASAFTVAHPTSNADVELRCDVVEMGGGWHYRGLSATPFQPTKTRTDVENGTVYLLSDNREIHDDSRDFGLLQSATCTERIVFRLWGKEGFSDVKRRMTYIH
jgi:signal peptidase I